MTSAEWTSANLLLSFLKRFSGSVVARQSYAAYCTAEAFDKMLLH